MNVSGAAYYCTTAQGGGWTVPVPTTAAARTVSFTGLNMNQNVNLTFPASTNAKADLKLIYSPPAITSPSTASTNTQHNMAFNVIGGATSYKWNRWTSAATTAENCENTTNITTSTTGTYAVLNTTVKQQGTASFHLTIPDFTSQSFQLNTLYYGNPSATLSFQSRIRAAFSSEHFKVQVKEEGGVWTDVYDQAGLGNTGEASFTLRTAALTAMVGKAFRIRFLQQYTSGSIYGVGDSTGWFVDAIDFSNISVLTNNSLQTLATNSGSFTPTAAGSYLMSVTPVISGHHYAASYQTLNVTSDTGVPTTVSVAVSTGGVLEDGAPNLVYTFTRTGATTSSLTANFTVGGTAALSTDYTQFGATSFTATTGTVNFAAGSATAAVTLDPIADTTVETNETAVLTVTTGTGYTLGTPIAATGTITNDDATVSVAVSPASVAEDGSGNLTYSFTRAGATTGPLAVSFTVGGTAAFGTDYTQSGASSFSSSTGTVTFAAGATTAAVILDPTPDTTVESDETATLTVTSGTGYTALPPTAATGTITNDDTNISVAVSPTSVLENGSPNLTFTLTRTGISTGSVTANFSVGGTATFSTDYTQSGAASYTATTGTVTFSAGTTTKVITLNPTADVIAEADETATLTVTSGTGYTPGTPASATGTITNDDTGVSVAVSPASVPEDGTGNLVYTFTRTGVITPTTPALTANFSVGGAATFATDYTQSGAASFTATTGTVTFATGAATKTVTLDPIADTTVETDETAALTVTSGTGYSVISPTSASGTITNDDTTVSIAASPASVTEDGSGNLTYTFTRAGATASALAVNFSVGGNAAFATDYTQSGASSFTSSTGTVTFAAGATTAAVILDPTPDTTVESDETATLTVTSGTGYTALPPTAATGTITNDDTSVSVAVSPSSVPEDSGQEIIYTFSRSGVSTGALTASFSVGGAAVPNADYAVNGAASFNTNSGTVTFPAGSTSANVRLHPTTDLNVEPDESVVLSVASNTGYQVGGAPSATGIIANDDTPPPSFASWAGTLETANSLPAWTLSANPNGDYDKDGRPNLVEYAFGASPVIANDPAPAMPTLQPSTTHLVLQYKIDTSLSGVTVTPQACITLGAWKTVNEADRPSGFTDTLISTTGTIQTREAKVPLTSGNKVFMRMQVAIP